MAPMAMYRVSAGVISRGKGQIILGALAYRFGGQFKSELTGTTKDYSGKRGEVVYGELMVPETAPDWAREAFGDTAYGKALAEVRAEAAAKGQALAEGEAEMEATRRAVEAFGTSVESAEQRLNKHHKRAQEGRKVDLSLPRELTREQQVELLRAYVKDQFLDRGMVAAAAIHDKGDGNPHAHIILSLRDLGKTDWGPKNLSWNTRSALMEWREAWAIHANLALERAGLDIRIDHRSLEAQGLNLEPENYNPYVADHAERAGQRAREKMRCEDVRRRNQDYLRENPEHILAVVQLQRAVFTEEDVRVEFARRLGLATEKLPERLIGRAMQSEELVQLPKRAPSGQSLYITRTRARISQYLSRGAAELARSQLPEIAVSGADPFETGEGPILVDVAAYLPAEVRSPKRASVPPQPVGKKRWTERARPARGPSALVVREALIERAEELFRDVHGEPLRAGSPKWSPKSAPSVEMQMQGPRRGLWFDHKTGQGGDLLELVAVEMCGLTTAKSDFPRVLEEAARYVGLSVDQPIDNTALEARRDAREHAAAEALAQDTAERAELVRAVVAQAAPAADSPAASYLCSRGVTDLPEAQIAYLGKDQLATLPGDLRQRVMRADDAALVVWATDAGGSITGGQRILITADGSRVDTEVGKPSFGSVSGHPARFPAGIEGGPLVVAESPEAALSIWQVTGHETWAVFGVSGFEAAPLPTDRHVILAPDRDAPDSPAGRAFRKAVAHHLAEGADLSIAVAPEPIGSKADLNDTLQRAGDDAVRAAIEAARPVQATLSPELNLAQRAAAQAMLNTDRLTLVQGHAGTGKTFTIGQAARAWQDRGYTVLAGAPSGKATQELAAISDVSAATLAAWEARWTSGDRPPEGRFVFIMDEAGMVGLGQWARIQARVAEMGGKLIAIGDNDQLQPVADLSGWTVAERAAGSDKVTVLDTVVRQQSGLDSEATQALARGGENVPPAIRYYAGKGALRLDDEIRAEPVSALAAAYFTEPDEGASRIALAYTNHDVHLLNEAIRSEAVARGQIDPETVRAFGTVTRRARIPGQGERTLEGAIELGCGDRIMLTRPHRALGLSRSAFGTVEAVRLREIDVRIDGTKDAVTIDLEQFRHLDYGYAATVHKSQGMTADSVFVLPHKRMHRHAVYVAMSRHRNTLAVFGRDGHLETPGDLIRLGQAPGHLEIDVPRTKLPDHPAMVPQVEGLAERADWRSPDAELSRVGFLGDAELMVVAERTAGLLSADWASDSPIARDDPRGYLAQPTQVIDDLIRRQSVIRAADVAGRLAEVAAEPGVFVQLFGQAMAHPDLVVLAEGTDSGGRVYTTKTQLQAELEAVDRGTRLALSPAAEGAPEATLVSLARATPGLDAELEQMLDPFQRHALEQSLAPGRLRLITGEVGTGKTRLAARVADLHRKARWQVLEVTPTGAGLDALRAAGAEAPRTLRRFLAETSPDGPWQEKVQLDPATLVVLDDAGRLGGREATELLTRIEESGAKLIGFTGGDHQTPFEAGAVFRGIQMRVGAARLERDHARAPRDAALLRQIMIGGDAAERAGHLLTQGGAVISGGTARRAARILAERYVADPSQDKIALTWSHKGVKEVTAAIRAELDAVDPVRAAFTPDEAGPMAGLKPGDRLMFVASTPWQGGAVERDAVQAPRLKVGDRAVVIGGHRDPETRARDGLILRIDGRDGRRDIRVTPEMEQIPEWRYEFATTIHGATGRTYDSVKVLASPGMTRQVLAAGLATHRKDIEIVLTVSEARTGDVLSGILRREAPTESVLDYGFDAGLGAREAAQSRPGRVEVATDGRGIEAAIGRLADRAGLDRVPDRNALPAGLEVDVLAEVIGAAVLDTGAAPEGPARMALEAHVQRLASGKDWRAMLAQLPTTLPREADEMARAAAGVDPEGRLLTVSRYLARGALSAREMGEEHVAQLFESGLRLYGLHAEAARSEGRLEDLVPPRAPRALRPEWPDPADRPAERERDGRERSIQRGSAGRGGGLADTVSLGLRATQWSDEAIGRLYLQSLPGVNALMSSGRVKRYTKAQQELAARARSRPPMTGRLSPELQTMPEAGHWEFPMPPGGLKAAPDRSQAATRRDAYGAMASDLAKTLTAELPMDHPVRKMEDISGRLAGLLERADTGPWGPQDQISATKLAARVTSLGGLGREDRGLAEAIDQALSNTVRSAPAVARGAGRSTPKPKTKDHGDLALQLASAITRHVDAKDPVHRTDLVADLQAMLQKADRAKGLSAAEVERRARDITRDRVAFETKKAFAQELVANAPAPTIPGVRPESFNEERFAYGLSNRNADGDHPMKLNSYPLRERYNEEVDGRVSKALEGKTLIPSAAERHAARLALLPAKNETERQLVGAIEAALRWGAPPDALTLRTERTQLLKELAGYTSKDPDRADTLVERLYGAFTQHEVVALSKAGRQLPQSVSLGSRDDRKAVAKGIRGLTADMSEFGRALQPWEGHTKALTKALHPQLSLGRGLGLGL